MLRSIFSSPSKLKQQAHVVCGKNLWQYQKFNHLHAQNLSWTTAQTPYSLSNHWFYINNALFSALKTDPKAVYLWYWVANYRSGVLPTHGPKNSQRKIFVLKNDENQRLRVLKGNFILATSKTMKLVSD